uniref:Synergin gamma C-terminal domain-containing protein n=1 Tax=Oryza sativa subsp. japonica TaxID=39947 RepID=Q2QXR9_ORYSJ|nr:hypothetical protein LOC_Os12g05100 [Oryza sativa Japonica Group]
MAGSGLGGAGSAASPHIPAVAAFDHAGGELRHHLVHVAPRRENATKKASPPPSLLAAGFAAGKLRRRREDWSLFTSVDENLNHVRTTNHIETCKSTGPNDAAILDLYKETELVDAVHMTQSSSESVQSPSDMFSNNEMNSSFETDENHSIKSSSDRTLIDFYHKLREETLTVIFRNGKDFKEICEKLPEGFCIEEHTAKDVFISELLDSAREVHLKDFEEEYHLIEKIPMHGVVLWQESCQSNVCSVVISQGGQFFIALGEIYRVAQILNLSLQSFKPWVLADPGMEWK